MKFDVGLRNRLAIGGDFQQCHRQYGYICIEHDFSSGGSTFSITITAIVKKSTVLIRIGSQLGDVCKCLGQRLGQLINVAGGNCRAGFCIDPCRGPLVISGNSIRVANQVVRVRTGICIGSEIIVCDLHSNSVPARDAGSAVNGHVGSRLQFDF